MIFGLVLARFSTGIAEACERALNFPAMWDAAKGAYFFLSHPDTWIMSWMTEGVGGEKGEAESTTDRTLLGY